MKWLAYPLLYVVGSFISPGRVEKVVEELSYDERMKIKELLDSPERDLAFFLQHMRNTEAIYLSAKKQWELLNFLHIICFLPTVLLALILWRVW